MGKRGGGKPDIQLGVTGTIEMGADGTRETVRQCCDREAFEESGLDIRGSRVLWRGRSVEKSVVKSKGKAAEGCKPRRKAVTQHLLVVAL